MSIVTCDFTGNSYYKQSAWPIPLALAAAEGVPYDHPFFQPGQPDAKERSLCA
jgi:hypothetical protein